jgi:hypothetical protein
MKEEMKNKRILLADGEYDIIITFSFKVYLE